MLKFHAVKDSADQQAVLSIYQSNPDYFALTNQPAPTLQTVKEDQAAHPGDTSAVQKHFGLLLVDSAVVGVLDRLEGYPDPDVVYIGLLMIRADHQRRGLGRRTITGLAAQFRRQGFRRIRVAVADNNTPALLFWERLGFAPVGESQAGFNAAVRQPVTILDRDLAAEA
ncbi:GNAT family N-acetyltransferase [Lacticaseibacillus jixianensis]|uniref:GNAT family N-acetyltransferase n=1 Tax=Lacticaseibacillus jixianensis TaxID=2486012 RepID=A0ABW4B831_9LACO|nr:GNAT family N-acetyltransferase [Lacticaseibacillus jixianensis]